jgi:hypothetical protein
LLFFRSQLGSPGGTKNTYWNFIFVIVLVASRSLFRIQLSQKVKYNLQVNFIESIGIMKTRERLINGKRRCLGKNQKRILDILEQYQELTAKDIAEIIWARDIRYQTAEYTSVHRSLRTLYKNGLVGKVGGKTKWRKMKRAHLQTSKTKHRC